MWRFIRVGSSLLLKLKGLLQTNTLAYFGRNISDEEIKVLLHCHLKPA